VGEVKSLVEERGVEWILANRTHTRIVHEEETTDDEPKAVSIPFAGSEQDISSTRRATSVAVTDADLRGDKKTAKHRSSRLFLSVVVLIVLVGAGGVVLRRFIRQKSSQAIPATTGPTLQLKRLTYDSKAFGPAVSPSGEYVAYRFHDAVNGGKH
jgi:hypothetical protein